MRYPIYQVFLLTGMCLYGQLSLAEDSLIDNELEPVIVTATRTAQTADQALASVTVISRKDIEKTQAKSIADLLRTKAGIHITQSGGYGKSTAVFVRGTGSDHVLVLVDGVRASSATLGTFSWEHFLPEQIEKIEIVRGPRASLYGSDAIGGVIQIFTRHNSAPQFSITTSENTNQFELGFGGGDQWKYNVQAGRFDTDGIPSFAEAIENDAYDNTHYAVSLNREFLNKSALKFRLAESKGLSKLDPDTGDIDFRNRVFSAELNLDISNNYTQKLVYGNALDVSKSFSPTVPSKITTKRESVSWQNDVFYWARCCYDGC